MIQLGSKIQTKIGNVVRTGVVQSIRVQNSKKMLTVKLDTPIEYRWRKTPVYEVIVPEVDCTEIS